MHFKAGSEFLAEENVILGGRFRMIKYILYIKNPVSVVPSAASTVEQRGGGLKERNARSPL